MKKAIIIYTGSNISKKMVAFLLLPILTTYLAPEEMGLLSLITTFAALFASLMAFSSAGAMRVNYYKIAREDYGSYVFSALVLPGSVVLGSLVPVLFFPDWLAGVLNVPKNYLWYIPVIPLISLITKCAMDLFRLEEKHWHFAAFQFGISVVEMCLSLLLIVSFSWGWEGRLWGIVLSTMGFFFVGWYYLRRGQGLTFRYNKLFARDAIRFGMPLIPFAISRQVVHSSDRIFIERMEGLADTGIYNVGYRVGTLIIIVISSLIAALAPYIFKTLKNADQEKKLRLVKIFYLFVGAMLVLLGITVLGGSLLFDFVLDKDYSGGEQYVFWVALSFIFHGVFEYMQLFIRFTKNTKPLFWIAIVNMGLNLVFNYIFIKEYGVIGAAYATALSYFISMLMILRASPKAYPMPWLKIRKAFKVPLE